MLLRSAACPRSQDSFLASHEHVGASEGMPPEDDRMSEQPTRARYVVLGFVCALAMITYLDRACFGMVAPTLAAELELGDASDLKWAFTAFAIAYALFEIPTG